MLRMRHSIEYEQSTSACSSFEQFVRILDATTESTVLFLLYENQLLSNLTN